MNKIIDSNAVEHTDTKDILNCQKQFYENLYDKVPVSENNSLTDTLGETEDKLSDEEAHNLVGKIIYAELLHALKKMKNEKKKSGTRRLYGRILQIFLDRFRHFCSTIN